MATQAVKILSEGSNPIFQIFKQFTTLLHHSLFLYLLNSLKRKNCLNKSSLGAMNKNLDFLST